MIEIEKEDLKEEMHIANAKNEVNVFAVRLKNGLGEGYGIEDVKRITGSPETLPPKVLKVLRRLIDEGIISPPRN